MKHVAENPNGGDRSYLVLYHATWCGHCTRLHAQLDADKGALKNAMANHVDLYAIESENKAAMKAASIRGYPTIIMYDKNGKELEKFQEQRSNENLIAFAKRHGTPDPSYVLREKVGNKMVPKSVGSCSGIQSEIAKRIQLLDQYVRKVEVDDPTYVEVRIGDNFKWVNTEHPDRLVKKLGTCTNRRVEVLIYRKSNKCCPPPDNSWTKVRGCNSYRKIYSIGKVSK